MFHRGHLWVCGSIAGVHETDWSLASVNLHGTSECQKIIDSKNQKMSVISCNFLYAQLLVEFTQSST